METNFPFSMRTYHTAASLARRSETSHFGARRITSTGASWDALEFELPMVGTNSSGCLLNQPSLKFLKPHLQTWKSICASATEDTMWKSTNLINLASQGINTVATNEKTNASKLNFDDGAFNDFWIWLSLVFDLAGLVTCLKFHWVSILKTKILEHLNLAFKY